MATHIAQETTAFATVWRVTRKDLTVFTYTDHDVDIITDVDDPAGQTSPLTYIAKIGFTRTTLTSSGAMNVDSVDMLSHIDGASLTEQDLRAGKWDHATVEMYLVNFLSVTDGVIKLRKGTLGEMSLKDDIYFAEFRSLTQSLAQVIGERATPGCRANLGDARCKVDLQPPDWLVDTFYNVGDRVTPTTFNHRKFIITTRGRSHPTTEPSWDTDIGDTTADGATPVVWSAAASKSLGDMVRPTSANGAWFRCTTAGTTAGSEPSPWDTDHGDTTADNTVVWTAEADTLPIWTTEEAFYFEDTIFATATNGTIRKFLVTVTGDLPGDARTTGHFNFGLLRFTSGLNSGRNIAIKNWIYDAGLGTATMAAATLTFADNGASADTITRAAGNWGADGFVAGHIITVASSASNNAKFRVDTVGTTVLTLHPDMVLVNEGPSGGISVTADDDVKEVEIELPMTFVIAVGDTVEYYAGCNKTVSRCISPFKAINNYRGEPYLPGTDTLLRSPDEPPNVS